ncbi:MAG TPA: zf-HC2 domain-containing protein [Acidobacteriaceae bacterium]|nr:zf-HC2 domain-containing protein [Acidobacteriaceae bacterium]
MIFGLGLGAILGSISCASARNSMAEYLDGRLTGREMQRISKHLDRCTECSSIFDAERTMLHSLALLGPVTGQEREPDDMVLRIRVALSQERARRDRSRFEQWQMIWRNTVGPFLLQLSAGTASAVLLLGSVALLVGMVAHPEHASAKDEPLGMATAPKLLYHSSASPDSDEIGTQGQPVVVEAYVDGSGRVYDYKIVTGPNNAQTRADVENLLLFSVFEPAKFYGQPVKGLAVLSFSGVSVRG